MFFFYLKNERIAHSPFLVSNVSKSLRSLTINERCERIAQRKWAMMSESLRLLTKNEQMSESHVFLANRSFAHFRAKNERCPRKTDERIPSPAFSCLILKSKSPRGTSFGLCFVFEEYRADDSNSPTDWYHTLEELYCRLKSLTEQYCPRNFKSNGTVTVPLISTLRGLRVQRTSNFRGSRV